MSSFVHSEIESGNLGDAVADVGMPATLNELRNQLALTNHLVLDIQSRLSRSNDAVLIYITLGTPHHQRSLTANEFFITQSINMKRKKPLNVQVFWRYALPTQPAQRSAG